MPTMLSAVAGDADGTVGVLRRSAVVALGVCLLTVSAKLQIPFWPVPFTMQTFVVLVFAMALGTRLALVTLAAYLTLGAFGLPVFAGTPDRGIGISYMVGPTGGYMVGFVAATLLCGWFGKSGWDRSVTKTAVAVTLGHIVILGTGFLWLWYLLGDAQKAYAVGIAPFYVATVAKTVLAMAALPVTWAALRRRKGNALQG